MAEKLGAVRRGALKKGFLVAKGLVESLSESRAFLYIAVVSLAAIVSFVATVSFQTIPTRIQVGQIASRDIKADRNYEIVDDEASGKFREEAMASVLPVLDFDAGLGQATIDRAGEAFAAARKAYDSWVELQSAKSRGRRVKLPDEAVGQIGEILADHLGVDIPEQYAKAMVAGGLGADAEADIKALVLSAMSVPLIAHDTEAGLAKSGSAIIRVVKEDGGEGERHEESIVDDVGLISTVKGARERMELTHSMGESLRDKGAEAAVLAIARLLTKPNCTLNRPETNRRLEEAAATAKNVILKVSAGEMIVREGSRYEPRHVKILTAIVKERRRSSYFLEFVGTFIITMLFLVVPFTLLHRYFRRVIMHRTDYLLMALVGLSMLVIMRISLMLGPALSEVMLYAAEPSTLYYAIPIAGAAMLIRMYLGAEISLVFALVMSVLAGLFVETDVRFMAFSLITSIMAVMAIANVDRRSLIIRAGVITGGIGAAAVVGISLIETVVTAGALEKGEVLWGILFAFLGGVGSAIYAMIAAPIIESLSDYTSDIKLLELANLNSPVLRELIVRAPGTYHHSHVVGLLGEAAAQSIGANALLVRVGAYYHDIGKIKKPLYFIENAKAGENRHEKLTPQMSTLIVAAHVKDGLELAQQAKVPRCIADMIPQHHGTRKIGFFYDKAKLKTDPDLMEVDEKQFRYPGPKPRTREAAILMLSDVTEASVRALKEKSPARIEQTVKKTINDIFNESQLDECDLTLRDLNTIGKAFVRILLGIYHLRIEYEKEMEKETENEKASQSENKAAPGSEGDSQERASEDEPTVKESD
jgi:putative nucleotidyltransferase with HDIG domain